MEACKAYSNARSLSRAFVVVLASLGVVALWALLVSPGWIVAQGPIVLDGVAGASEWDPSWQVATDPLDVTVTGTGNHPHDAPTYARSGYDAIALWAHYDVAGTTWYFRTDVDGRAADSDSQTGTPGNLGVGTHDVDGGPLGGDSTGIGSPEAYRLQFQYQSGGPMVRTRLGGVDPGILPGAIGATTGDLIGQGVYSTTFNPGVIEWALAKNELIPAGSYYRELWLGAQMGDNSDFVSDDDVQAVLVIALDQVAGCPASPAVVGSQATFPLDYAIPAAASLGVSDVVLTADVPPGTTFISASNGGTESGGVITWNLGDLSPGDAGQVTFVLRVDASMTSLTINSEITCAEGLRYQSSAECPVQQPPPTLNVVANCPATSIVVGSQATFPLDYGIPASGISGATNVVLTADVPAGTTFISASSGGTESGGVITWNLGNLSPGDAGQVTFVLRVDASMTSLTINSAITCDEGVSDQDTAVCPVQQPPSDLGLVVNCPSEPIYVGRRATFPLDYALSAASAAGITNVVLTADVPAGTTFNSASNGGTESGGVITWNLGNLSPGDAGRVSFTVRVNAAVTSLTVNSEITCDEGLQYEAANVCPVQTLPPGTEIPEGSTFLLLGSGLAAMAALMGLARARLRR